jgi:hypothetical protein
VRSTVSNCSRGGSGSSSGSTSQLSGMRVTTGPAMTVGVDKVSMMHDSSSIQANWESRINMLVEEMTKELQESWRSWNADGIRSPAMW